MLTGQGNDDIRGNEFEVESIQNKQFEDASEKDQSTGRRVQEKDWICTSCNNSKRGWRNSCNKCGISKTFSMVSMSTYALGVLILVFKNARESREGKAGGFNERQERISKSSLEVDPQGYDDFGRKKQSTKASKQEKAEAALKRLQQNYGFLMSENKESTDTAGISTEQTDEKDTKSSVIPAVIPSNERNNRDAGEATQKEDRSRRSRSRERERERDKRDRISRDGDRSYRRDSRDRYSDRRRDSQRHDSRSRYR